MRGRRGVRLLSELLVAGRGTSRPPVTGARCDRLLGLSIPAGASLIGCRADESELDGVLDQFGAAGEPQLPHHGVFVKGNRAGCQLENVGRFLHRSAFGQQLKHFTLTQAQVVLRATMLGPLDENRRWLGRNPRCDVEPAGEDMFERREQLGGGGPP